MSSATRMRAEEAFTLPRTRRPGHIAAAARRDRARARRGRAARCSPRCSRTSASRSACRACCSCSCCSSIGVSAVGGLCAGARRGDQRLPARQLVLHAAALHVHDQRRREHPRPCRLPRRRGRSSACSSTSPPAALLRATARAPRPRPSHGWPARRRSTPCSTACGGCSGWTEPRSCTARKAAGGSRQRAVTASRRAPRPPRRRSSSTPTTCSPSPASRSAPRISGCSKRSPRSSRPRSSWASSRPRSRPPGVVSAANELRAAILSAVSHDLRTPLAGDQGLRHEPVAGRRRLDARGAARVPRHDRRGDRPPERARREPARHEPAPDGRAGDHAEPRRARRGAPRGLAQPRASPTSTIELDVPETLPRVLADPGLLERALANLIETPSASRRPEARLA